MEAFSEMKAPIFEMDATQIRLAIADLCQKEPNVSPADRFVTKYYSEGGDWIWIDRMGIDCRTDSLLERLRRVADDGLSERSFFIPQIERDIERFKNLDFDSLHQINRVMARLEYFLTKAYVRYTTGMCYGFVNPDYVWNRVDPFEIDTLGRPKGGFKRLFDIPLEHADASFYAATLRKVVNDSIGAFIDEVAPKQSMYHQLQRMLTTANEVQRQRILCNMEQCRWRWREPMKTTGKRIVVNIPAFYLYAFDGNGVLDMKVGCGAIATKTPQLTSEIKYMEVNPLWNIPASIIEHDVARRAGDSAYFARNRYFIVDKNTGDKMEIGDVSRAMLLSGKYRVSQEGGRGNSLGRIVFRFPNNFSVYLHDTSTRGFFARDNRGVSHGCVRVEKPFELAKYLLGNADEWTLDKLRISMGMRAETERGRTYVAHTPEDDRKLVSSLGVHPPVPLYIIYRTIYPDAQGNIQFHPDVYGFDAIIWSNLKPYMQ